MSNTKPTDGGAPDAPAGEDAPAGDDAPSAGAATTDSACALALRALAAGEYDRWSGLTDACTTADAEAAFGPGAGDKTGFPGGSPTHYRSYPKTANAPFGLDVYDVQGRIVYVVAHDLVPKRPLDEMLGPPEDKMRSEMPGFKTMWIWASRGLTLHVDNDTGKVAWLYAYAPMTVAAFRTSWLAKVEIHRTRVRR